MTKKKNHDILNSISDANGDSENVLTIIKLVESKKLDLVDFTKSNFFKTDFSLSKPRKSS